MRFNDVSVIDLLTESPLLCNNLQKNLKYIVNHVKMLF